MDDNGWMAKTSSIRAIPAPPAPVFPLGVQNGVASGPQNHSLQHPSVHRHGFLGLVMLDTHFPRPPGDLGNPESYPVPTRRAVVQGAFPAKVVQSAAGLRAGGLLVPFTQAVCQLEADGARAITTSCGFLVLLQRELQAAVAVPVVTSSLLLLPRLLVREPQVGVLTISAARLGRAHLRGAGVPSARLADVLVQGVDPHGSFARTILGNQTTLDVPLAQADVVAAAQALKRRAPALRSVVLECTNMPPYAHAIAAATGLKPLSLLDCSELFAPFSSSTPAAQARRTCIL